ncbi:unnamed protein product [Anisakis simplex]|uniref:Phospholipid scramblase n=1 Tax=Anisakis simplex TaxID=6269 RepID=A0A0M3JCU9_ANISI|nr:unnamed protein product [Anisakis simplex]
MAVAVMANWDGLCADMRVETDPECLSGNYSDPESGKAIFRTDSGLFEIRMRGFPLGCALKFKIFGL